MAAPLTGAANAPDVAASPMPAAAIPAIKIVRIAIPPSIMVSAAATAPGSRHWGSWREPGRARLSENPARRVPIRELRAEFPT